MYESVIADIYATLEKQFSFGLDIRLLRETVEEVNNILKEIGVKLNINYTGNCYINRDKTVITNANATLYFFEPEKELEGIELNKLDSVLFEIKRKLETFGIGIDDSALYSNITIVKSKARIVSSVTTLNFKK